MQKAMSKIPESDCDSAEAARSRSLAQRRRSSIQSLSRQMSAGGLCANVPWAAVYHQCPKSEDNYGLMLLFYLTPLTHSQK